MLLYVWCLWKHCSKLQSIQALHVLVDPCDLQQTNLQEHQALQLCMGTMPAGIPKQMAVDGSNMT